MMGLFSRPEWLLTLPLVAIVMGALWWAGRQRLAVVRGLIGTALVLAMADPSTQGLPALERVVHVVDTSRSIPVEVQEQVWTEVLREAQDGLLDARVGVIQVDATARIVAPPTTPTALPETVRSETDLLGTDLATGLTLAAQLLPEHAPGRVVVHTDGQTDPESLVAPLEQLARRGVTVEARPPVLKPAAARLAGITVPREADVGATVDGTLDVWGGSDGLRGAVSLTLTDGDGTEVKLAPVQVTVPALTRSDVPVSVIIPPDVDAGLWTIRAAWSDQEPVLRGLYIDTPPAVLLVQGTPRDGAVLAGVLRAEGMQVQTVRSTGPPALDGDLDLVILAGTPTSGAGALPANWLASLGPFVEEGGGLLTLSGPGGYAAGGWQDSSLAPILPVRIDPDGAEKDDSVSLLVVLDKSGSMARPASDARNADGMISGVSDMMLGGRAVGSKIRVASEAAAATMTKLRDHDRVGVLAVDTLPYWAVEMTPAQARVSAMDKARKISASGGGMYVLTALETSAAAMRKEDSPLRHILMLVDASDAGEQTREVFGHTRGALDLAKELGEEGITISVVGIGWDESRDSPFLRRLTRAGGGRLKLTSDIRTVSALFSQEVEKLIGSAENEQAPVRLRARGWHPALQGLDLAAAPAIHGWSDVLKRDTARTVLTTPAGTPVFAVWNRGLGQVAAWTSDDGARWARGWPAWSGSAVLWTQLARDLSRSAGSKTEGIAIDTSRDRVRVQVQHTNEDGHPLPVGALQTELTVDGQTVPLPPPELVAPGTVAYHLRAVAGSRVRVSTTTAAAADGARTAADTMEAIVPSSPEHAGIGLNRATLALLDQPSAESPPLPGPRWFLWPWLLGFAALLLPLDARMRSFRTPRPS